MGHPGLLRGARTALHGTSTYPHIVSVFDIGTEPPAASPGRMQFAPTVRVSVFALGERGGADGAEPSLKRRTVCQALTSRTESPSSLVVLKG